MATPPTTPDGIPTDLRPDAVEPAILRSVTEHAGEWFPGVSTRPTVSLRQLVNRPRAALYAVHLDGSPAPCVLAKVRRDSLASETGVWAGTRPRLAVGPLPGSELVALEYAGLRAIEASLGPAHPEFAAVRPLAHLVDAGTILMDYVDARTLRQVLLGQSRLTRWRRTAGPAETDELWRRVGAWLRLYQRSVPTEELSARQATRDEIVERLAALDRFLTDRLGRRRLGNAVGRGIELAARALPDRLSMAVGHGDFAPRNVFVLRGGRLAVFDPMPRWAVPRFEDLSRFLVSTRLLGIQLHTHGAAFSEDSMARRERLVIEGYVGNQDLPLAELRCLQLLVALDHWSALVDTPGAGTRRRVRQISARSATGYLRRETQRVVGLLEAELGGSSAV
jgi:hypothetical protein